MRKLPERFLNEADQFVSDHRRTSFIIGRFLIMQVLSFFHFDQNEIEGLKLTESGRPFIRGELDFNLSHSGNLIVCVGSISNRIGVDIEKKKNIKPESIGNALTTDELVAINSAPEPSEKLLEFWTKKESLAKAEGIGIINEFNDIMIYKDKGYFKHNVHAWHFYPLQLHQDYIGYICSNHAVEHFVTEEYPVINFS